MKINWRNFSGSLLARSVYLITIPIVLIQIIGIIIFFELHWDLVLKRSAQSISNEIKILEMEKNSPSIDNFSNTLQIIRVDNFEINEAEEISNLIFKRRIKGFLSQISSDFNVLQNEDYFIFFNQKKTDYFYLIPRKRVETNTLTFSIFNEKIIPKMIPDIVAKKPMVKPVKKKDFFIDALFNPKVFRIAISLVLFFINIVRPEIILNAATMIISVSIINITFLSTFKALKKDLFKSDQV